MCWTVYAQVAVKTACTAEQSKQSRTQRKTSATKAVRLRIEGNEVM